jgi:hypothetical protein
MAGRDVAMNDDAHASMTTTRASTLWSIVPGGADEELARKIDEK